MLADCYQYQFIRVEGVICAFTLLLVLKGPLPCLGVIEVPFIKIECPFHSPNSSKQDNDSKTGGKKKPFAKVKLGVTCCGGH